MASAVLLERTLIERKAAARQIELLNYALDHVNEEVFLVEENADLSYVNGSACRGRESTREELLQLNITVLDPNFPMERWTQYWQELKEKGSLHFETLHTRKDGQTFPVEISANYFEFDGKGYNLSLVHDITESTRMHEAIAEREQEFRSLAESLPDFIIRVGSDLRLRYINANMVKYLALGSAEEVIGRRAIEVYPDGRFNSINAIH